MKKEYVINGFFIFLHSLNYKITKRRVPLMVSLGLTNKCNLNCIFCYAKDQENVGIPDYNTQQLKSYINQFIKLGTRIFLLQGGEPCLRPDLKEIISYIKNKERFCRISTNGVLVANRIDALLGADQLSFSLDGNEQIVEQTRGKGIYQKVIEGMDAAFANKIPFEIHAALVRESAFNNESIMSLFDLAKKYNTQVSFCVSVVSGAENTKSVGTGELTTEETKKVYQKLIELKKQGYPISNTFNSLKKAADWPISYTSIGFKENLPSDYKYDECRHGRLICWLDGDNTLCPCPTTFFRPEYASKVNNGNIKDAWEKLGPKAKCIACGSSDESTTFFALNFEDWMDVIKKMLWK
ncbi:MAG: radical SAM protein [Patescibacteria group bacterium]|nr:radical SAM protein [Patescibacteria group bacterium]